IPPYNSREGLKELYCEGCIALSQIPYIKQLKKLDCAFCRLITKIPHRNNSNNVSTATFGCVWLNKDNLEPNLKNLMIIQQHLKTRIACTKIKKLIVTNCQFPSIYYDPIAKGGYLHKQEMFRYISLLEKSC